MEGLELMAHYSRFPDLHPFCTCPPVTFTSGPTPADREACRRHAPIDPHPTITDRDIRALAFLARPREAHMTTWTVPAVITRVVDGDTVEARLDLGWRVTMTAKIRLAGINCPEIDTPEGVAARAFTVNTLNRLMPVGDTGPLAAPVKVISHSLDKYGRVLGDVRYPPANTPSGLALPVTSWVSLADQLLAAGHAVVMP